MDGDFLNAAFNGKRNENEGERFIKQFFSFMITGASEKLFGTYF